MLQGYEDCAQAYIIFVFLPGSQRNSLEYDKFLHEFGRVIGSAPLKLLETYDLQCNARLVKATLESNPK